jgi:predicted glycosyltransferase involved in capsule biosynthesis
MSRKLSIIIAVLESYGIVNHQVKYFKQMNLPSEIEIIIVDDGSSPPIAINTYCDNLRVYITGDTRPWTTACARNMGANLSEGEWLLMTDIDHMLSKEAIIAAMNFDGDKMMFPREYAVFDNNSNICQDCDILESYGLKGAKIGAGCHTNTFAMRRGIFENLGGYDEKFCGKYGGDDVDLADRYGALFRQGLVTRHVMGPKIYVYPDPKSDIKSIFHGLRRKASYYVQHNCS